MGAKGDWCICGYCGKTVKRKPHMTSAFIKCVSCQKKGKKKLLHGKEWDAAKMKWLRKLKYDKRKKRLKVTKR